MASTSTSTSASESSGTDDSGSSAARWHTGQCYCGAVQFAVTGRAQWRNLCHCSKCRILIAGAGPTLACRYPAAQFQQRAGHDDLSRYQYGTETHKDRVFCTRCGTRVWTRDHREDGYNIYLPALHDAGGGGRGAATLSAEWMEGARHICYDSRLLGWPPSGDDGLPKYRNGPGSELCAWDNAPLAPVQQQEDDSARTAQCACGDVRYKMTGPCLGVGICHCSLCRSLFPTDTPYWVNFAAADAQLLTDPSAIATRRVGQSMHSAWCRRCGCRLWLCEVEADPVTSFSAGIFDFAGGREKLAGRWPSSWFLDHQIFIGSRLTREHQVNPVSDRVPCYVGSQHTPPVQRCDWGGRPLPDAVP